MSQSTSDQNQQIVINHRQECSVCGTQNLSVVMELPRLPITGIFSKDKPIYTLHGFDQYLLWCPACGHGQLRNQINPSILYDSSKYSFKTSISATARHGTENFISFLNSVSSKKRYDCILDVGCNDLYLLERLGQIGRNKVGIDPIWKSKSVNNIDETINVIGNTVEEANLINSLPTKPDLILCRHTLEHIYNPSQVLQQLIECSTDDALFVFELPSFESLIERIRFDQIFHEHLQYFSKSSFQQMLIMNGGRLIKFSENFHDWGSLLIAFKKSGGREDSYPFSFSMAEIEKRLELFRGQLEKTRQIALSVKTDTFYGYGAALMLPVLAYHLKDDFSFLAGVIDDDANKDGIYYQNLPLRIMHASKINNLEKASIFITAVDNVAPIMTKLLASRPRHIVYPFNLV